MRGIIRVCSGLLVIVAGLTTSGAPAVARDRLLRCATSPASLLPLHASPRSRPHPLYAPVRSAMFFSQEGSICRWTTPRLRHG